MATIFNETFETDGNGTRYVTSTPEFSDGFSDFFTRTDGSDISGGYQVSGGEGSFFFAAQDINGEGAASEQTLSFSGIDISGFVGLQFSVLLAEDDDGSNQDWDVSDFVKFEYRIDGGAFQDLLAIESIPDGDNFNAVPAIDTDFDGDGDGTEITDAFTRFSQAIAGTGSTLDLRITFDLNSGDEDIAIDDLKIEGVGGDTPPPPPAGPSIVISEIMYNPASSEDDWEWVEIVNSGDAAIDLSGWVIDDGNSLFFDSANIASGTVGAGEAAVLFNADDLTAAAFEAAWGTGINLVGVTGWSRMALNNGGDTVALWESFDDYAGDEATRANAVAVVAYDDSGAWPSDNNSASIHLTDLAADPADGANWARSTDGGATPVGEGLTSTGLGGDSGADVGSPGGAEQAPGPLAAPYSFDFESDLFEEGWTVFSVDADDANTWFPGSFSGDNFAEVNAFGGDAPADDWLITPAFDLDQTEDEALSLVTTKNFEDDGIEDPEITLLYSTDYSGSGDPTAATWIELPLDNFSPGGFVDAPSGPIDISDVAGASVHFAVRYQSSGNDGGSSSLWQVDDFAIEIDDGGGEPGGAPTERVISEVQGAGAASPIEGEAVIVEAIVTGDFQDGDADDFRNLAGFFLMEEAGDRDGDAATSEGLFVFDGAAALPADVAEGDRVRITGVVEERFGRTQIAAESVEVVAAGAVTDLDAFAVDSALPGLDGREAVESMLLDFSDTFTVIESFNTEQFGEFTLSTDGERQNFTQLNAPDQAGFAAHVAERADETILIDDGTDGRRSDFDPITEPDGDLISLDSGFRLGQDIAPISAIMDFGFNQYRLRLPGFETFDPDVPTNPRPEGPGDVGDGSLRVATLNVLNYFTDLNQRGAETTEELIRQTEKLVSIFRGMDADIIGLVEIQNNGDEAIGQLTDALNGDLTDVNGQPVSIPAALDDREYGFVSIGVVGSDEITTGFIYDTLTVELSGMAAVFDDPAFLDPLGAGRDLNRPAVAQTFREKATEGEFTAVVNHFKSKGSLSGDPRDEDQGDGAGNNNATRAAASQELLEWLATDPTGSGDDDVMILGDLNAYAKEDPIRILEDGGFTNLKADFQGPEANSYRFSGEIGTLDYALANTSLAGQVTGAAGWTINSGEHFVFDYNTNATFQTPVERPTDQGLFDGDNPAKASDHDPVIVGLDLESDAPAQIEVVGAVGGRGERLVGTGADERFLGNGGRRDIITTGDGADTIVFGDWVTPGAARGATVVTDFDPLLDTVEYVDGAEVVSFRESARGLTVFFENRSAASFAGVDEAEARASGILPPLDDAPLA